MRTISLALYAEGTTDYRFLPVVIQNAVENILFSNNSPDIAVVEPTLITGIKERTEENKILAAAKAAQGVHILFIHMDGDTKTLTEIKEERFYPFEKSIKESSGRLCRDLVPVIPIKNIEAWLTCDYEAFCQAVGTHATPEILGIPLNPRLVESLADPKHTFKEALRIAHSLRRKKSRYDPGEYYEILGRTIKLESLMRVPAFRAFYDEVANKLREMRIIL